MCIRVHGWLMFNLGQNPVSRFAICCLFLCHQSSPSHFITVRSNPPLLILITCQFLWSHGPRIHCFLTIRPSLRHSLGWPFHPLHAWFPQSEALEGSHQLRGCWWDSCRGKLAHPTEQALVMLSRKGLPSDRKPKRNLKQDNCHGEGIACCEQKSFLYIKTHMIAQNGSWSEWWWRFIYILNEHNIFLGALLPSNDLIYKTPHSFFY